MNVDTDKIWKALAFYGACGYKPVTVPYVVPKEYSAWTKPPERPEFPYLDGSLVYTGSAEQGFGYLIDQGMLVSGEKYMGLTPCFRSEPEDETHFKVFLKLELCVVGVNAIEELGCAAANFFYSLGVRTYPMSTDLEVSQIDLNSQSDLELGSYGTRLTPKGTLYTYGTGIAEPRTTYALQIEKESH